MKPHFSFSAISVFLLAVGAAAAAPLSQRTTPIKRGAAPKVIRVDGQVQAGKLVHVVHPVYPPDAKKAGIQGTVVLEAVIDKAGSVEQLHVTSGPCSLARSALVAVYRWKYEPTMVHGEPVGVETMITVRYTLGGPGAGTLESPGTAVPPPITAPRPGQKRAACGGNGFQTARLIHGAKLAYPPDAMRAGVQGTVILEALIDKDGRVKRLTYVSGPRGLVKAAMDAERQSRYEPALLDGRPVTVEKAVTVRFRRL